MADIRFKEDRPGRETDNMEAKPEKSGDTKQPVLTIPERQRGCHENLHMEVIMNALNPNTLVMLTTLSAVSTLAQASELTLATSLAGSPEPGMQPPPMVVYRNLVTTILAVREDYAHITIVGDAEKTLWNATNIRTNALSMTVPRASFIMPNDRTSFSIYAPMRPTNSALTVAGYVSGARLNDSMVTLGQVATFAVKRQVNTEFAYSLKTDSHSKFDSAITYRLNPNSGLGKSDLVIGLRYRTKF